MKFYNSGFVIQRQPEQGTAYKGIEGDNWFFIDRCGSLYKYYEENIDLAWDEGHADCCRSRGFMAECIEYCERNGLKFRVLFCRTQLSGADIPVDTGRGMTFLGYDYAYSGGSYYSCVNNDLIRKFPEFNEIMPNDSGLLVSETQLERFIMLREMAEKKYPELTFERGFFSGYMLYEVTDNSVFYLPQEG